jgi:hypothetical protein
VGEDFETTVKSFVRKAVRLNYLANLQCASLDSTLESASMVWIVELSTLEIPSSLVEFNDSASMRILRELS